MFTLQSKESYYWWPVEISRPSRTTPGTFETSKFDVQFRSINVTDQEALMREVSEKSLDDVHVVPRLVVGFREICDAAGAEVLYSEETLGLLLDSPGVASAIVGCYFECRAGQGKAKK